MNNPNMIRRPLSDCKEGERVWVEGRIEKSEGSPVFVFILGQPMFPDSTAIDSHTIVLVEEPKGEENE